MGIVFASNTGGTLVEGPDGVNERLRRLPPVDRVVERASEGGGLARWSLLAAARSTLAARRERPEDFAAGGTDLDPLARETRAAASRLEAAFPRRVLNATGIVLHTNLGRAPLAPGAARAAADAAAGYSDLEFDRRDGRRGSRLAHVRRLLELLSGAEAALVVNNAAAALLLAVDTLAAGREAVLSRGEMVEIGGSFRMPEIVAASRARLVEVGTTTRTHLRDYRAAIGPDTALLLKVHRSNFSIRGFASEVGLDELAQLGRERGLPVVEDRGSGTFVDLRPHGIPEAEVWRGLEKGADLVLFSGDKLLGGPQAGIALGRREPIERMGANPLARALRVDKLTLAALDWTLRALLDGHEREIPVLRMLTAPPEELEERAGRIARGLAEAGWGPLRVERRAAPVGGGALPELELDGFAVRLELGERAAGELAARLRQAETPVLVRVSRGAVWLDPRTLSDADADALPAAFGPPD